jgi:hypothetical protein
MLMAPLMGISGPGRGPAPRRDRWCPSADARENAGVRDEPEPPSEADGGATWVASVRAPAARAEVRRAPRWLRVVRALVFLAAGVFAMVGFFREKSLDLDLPEGSPHLGFHGQRLPEAWICSDDHQHYSLPFWMGGVLIALGAAALGPIQRRVARRWMVHAAGAEARPPRSA